MQPWKTVSRQTILDCGKFLVVEQHQIELPNGQIIPDWAWVITPDFVNVMAVTEAGQFICFRQTKYAVPEVILGITGGYIEPGEEPLISAQRELLEETGYEASQWTSLGAYAVDGNRGAGQAHLFLATEAHPVAPPEADDLEEQELVLLSRAEVEQALAAGEFKVLPWAAAVSLALLRLS
jgi:ADP-ribose pyrophosphatase